MRQILRVFVAEVKLRGDLSPQHHTQQYSEVLATIIHIENHSLRSPHFIGFNVNRTCRKIGRILGSRTSVVSLIVVHLCIYYLVANMHFLHAAYMEFWS